MIVMNSNDSANTTTPPDAGTGSDAGAVNDAVTQLVNASDIRLEDASLLVVDDNEQNLELLIAYLEPLGCEIRTAVDGVDALKVIEDKHPDLILLDVMMPRMSGFEVCKKLKADPATRGIPIIMVTALNEVSDIERGVESGTDDFLSKPVNKLELLTRVRNLLRIHQLKRELDRHQEKLRSGDTGVEDAIDD